MHRVRGPTGLARSSTTPCQAPSPTRLRMRWSSRASACRPLLAAPHQIPARPRAPPLRRPLPYPAPVSKPCTRFQTCVLVWCAAFAVGLAGGAHRTRALRCGGARRNVFRHRTAARGGIIPGVSAASLAAPACGARSALAGTSARVCACQRGGRACGRPCCVLRPTPPRAGVKRCRGALP